MRRLRFRRGNDGKNTKEHDDPREPHIEGAHEDCEKSPLLDILQGLLGTYQPPPPPPPNPPPENPPPNEPRPLQAD
jgi:hypothetical protein